MLVWNANFQIPNSGAQSPFLYLFAEKRDDKADLYFYSDSNRINIMWKEEIEFSGVDSEIYDYVLSLEKYQQYKKA